MVICHRMNSFRVEGRVNLIDRGKNDVTGKLAREQSLCRPGEAGELHPAGLPGSPAPGGTRPKGEGIPKPDRFYRDSAQPQFCASNSSQVTRLLRKPVRSTMDVPKDGMLCDTVRQYLC